LDALKCAEARIKNKTKQKQKQVNQNTQNSQDTQDTQAKRTILKNSNPIRELRIEAEKAWDKHFNMCEDEGIWTRLNTSISDIKVFEQSWKIRWIEKQLESLSNSKSSSDIEYQD
jgi:hypothetical protein